jgi:hypothetical protein
LGEVKRFYSLLQASLLITRPDHDEANVWPGCRHYRRYFKEKRQILFRNKPTCRTYRPNIP